MALIIADTDVLIDFLAGRGAADRVAQALRSENLHTTTITRFELLAGAKGKRREEVVRTLLAAVPALALDSAAADRAASVRRDLEKKGVPIGMADSLIAGIALEHRGVVLTRNVRHFRRVAELEVEAATAE
jgi:tRNA(fMet)-specific endonuclease VapC